MGLLGKLFEKKECAICGGEIGLLGNRKLEDGNLCKNCAAKLSPWFDDRRHSTVDQIKEQLAYREENKKVLDHFSVTRSFGDRYLLCLDENQRKFLVARTKDYRSENADVMDYSQVTSCELSISELTNEEKREVREKDGTTKKISYVPPQYIYSYDFTLKLKVNHPYFDDISFRLNDTSVEVRETGRPQLGRKPGRYDRAYQFYEQMGEDIKRILMDRSGAGSHVGYSSAPQQAGAYATAGSNMNAGSAAMYGTSGGGQTAAAMVTCPYCGASVHAGKFCEACGGPLQ